MRHSSILLGCAAGCMNLSECTNHCCGACSSYRGSSRGGYRGGPPSYGSGGREGNADRLVDQLQELVGVLA